MLECSAPGGSVRKTPKGLAFPDRRLVRWAGYEQRPTRGDAAFSPLRCNSLSTCVIGEREQNTSRSPPASATQPRSRVITVRPGENRTARLGYRNTDVWSVICVTAVNRSTCAVVDLESPSNLAAAQASKVGRIFIEVDDRESQSIGNRHIVSRVVDKDCAVDTLRSGSGQSTKSLPRYPLRGKMMRGSARAALRSSHSGGECPSDVLM